MALIEEMEDQGNFLFKYRSNLPLVILVLGLGVFVYNKITGVESYGDSYWFVCLAVGLAGLLVRIYTVGHTPANTSGRNTDQGQLADELNTTGIYSTVRHPLYLGNFLMWLGVGMLAENTWFIVAFTFMYWVYYERIMFAEEAFLRRKFDNIYLDWAAQTPAFIPSLKKFKSAKYPFSIKKVLKKEKNGVAALFGLFWIFEVVGNYLENGETIEIEKSFWFYAFVASTIFYFIFKIIKSKTTMLDEEGR